MKHKKWLAAIGIAAVLAIAFFWNGDYRKSAVSVEDGGTRYQAASGTEASQGGEQLGQAGSGQNDGPSAPAGQAQTADPVTDADTGEQAADPSGASGSVKPEEGAAPGQAAGTGNAAEPTETANPIKPGESSDASKAGGTSDGAKAGEGANPAKAGGSANSGKPGEASDAAKAGGASDGAKAGEGADPAKAGEATNPAKPSDTAGSAGASAGAGQPSGTEKPAAKQDKYLTDPVPAGKPKPVEWQDASVNKKKELTATLSVTAATILNNLAQFNEDKLEVLPEDGVIYKARTVTFYEGESVFDVLLREMKKHKIHMEFEMTPIYNSNYIEGINNIYEFDCGELSGWMYKVNGWFPNYGSSRYALQDGDVVEWVYTCDLGRDIGGGMAAGGGKK